MDVKHLIKRYLRALVLLFKEKEIVEIPKPVNTSELLKDKVALITGGSSGLGLAMAKAFINSGCKVVIAGTKEEKLKEIMKDFGAEDAQLRSIVLDVLDINCMSDRIREAASLFSENRIDILVNSAGIMNHTDFFHMSEQEYDHIMDVNVKGTYFMSQAMGNYMRENGIKGHILNVSSSSALRPAWTPYQLSKWAVRGMTLGLSDLLLPYGIIVNAIAPGPVATPMQQVDESDNLFLMGQPSERYAVPSEIAALAVFMVSDMGNLIVGDSFYITGGSGTISYHN